MNECPECGSVEIEVEGEAVAELLSLTKKQLVARCIQQTLRAGVSMIELEAAEQEVDRLARKLRQCEAWQAQAEDMLEGITGKWGFYE
jgi:hypothetical protein